MSKFFTLIGAWVVLFPVNVVTTTFILGAQYVWALFNMPVDLWHQLDEELNQIHIEDE